MSGANAALRIKQVLKSCYFQILAGAGGRDLHRACEVARLRWKIKPDPDNPRYIHTGIWGRLPADPLTTNCSGGL